MSRDPYDVAWYDEYLDRSPAATSSFSRGRSRSREYDPEWPRLYAREEERIRSALGDRVVRIEHAGLDVGARAAREAAHRHRARGARIRADEPSYVPDLEAAGYRVVIREPEWYEHRVFKGPDTNVNLHTFTAGCEEVDTMLLFRDHLRDERGGSGAVRAHEARARRVPVEVRAAVRRREDRRGSGDRGARQGRSSLRSSLRGDVGADASGHSGGVRFLAPIATAFLVAGLSACGGDSETARTLPTDVTVPDGDAAHTDRHAARDHGAGRDRNRGRAADRA